MADEHVKFLRLFLLYFAQGLPYGIQTKLLPILLRTRSVSLSKVSFSRILSFPWLFKILVSPYLEQFSSLWCWLMFTFIGMAVCCSVPGILGTEATFVILGCVFGLNIMAAGQDIAVDTMAIRILDSCDLGKGNIAQVVGYKAGALLGGGVLVWTAAFATWETVFLSIACFYLILAAYAYRMHLHETKNHFTDNKHTIGKYTDSVAIGINSPLFNSVIRSKGFKWIVSYVFVYKLGEQGMASMVPLYLLDNGFLPGDVGLMTGIVTQFFSIAGSIFGGWAASKRNTSCLELVRLLKWISLARLVPMAMHCITLFFGQSMTFLLVSECILQLIGGIVTTVTFTLMMQFSKDVQSHAQATHFSVLATAEVLGKLSIMFLAGTLVELMGYLSYFCLCFVLSVAVIFVLILYNHKDPILHKL